VGDVARPRRAPDPWWKWPSGSVVLGRTRREKHIWVPPEMRSIHTHIIGASNQGKSKLLEGMIRQDVLEPDGMSRSVIVLDPHGTLTDDVLRWFTTYGLHRVRRIRVLDPGDPTYVFGMNPVRRRDGIDPAVVASATLNAMTKVWGGEDATAMPQLRESLKAILYTLTVLNLTLLEADELVSIEDENALRRLAIETVDHPSIRRFWRTIEALRPRERDEKLGSAVRRLNEFLLPTAVRNIIGQRERVIDFRQVMDAGEVVLVNLSYGNGRISEDEAALLGTLMLNDLFLSCLGRPKGATPTYVYVDECQRYLTQDIANILDQARKFGLHLTLAHQHVGHLREAGEHIYRSVMTNARTKIVFGGLDDEDATLMARNLFRGTFDLQKEKSRYDKPVMVDQVPDWLLSESEGWGTAHAIGRSTSRGGGEAKHQSTTKSRSTTVSESETVSESDTISESHSDSWSDTESDSTTTSSARTQSESSGDSSGRSDGSNWSAGTNRSSTNSAGASGGNSYAVNTSNSLFGPQKTGERQTGRSDGTNQGTANTAGANAGWGGSSARSTGSNSNTGSADTSGMARSHSSAHTEGGTDTHGTAHTSGVAYTTGRAETEGTAETEGATTSTNWSVGSSTTDTVSRQHTHGRSQSFRSVLQVMPTQSYALDDLVHIASVRLTNLDVGEAIVKIGRRPPARIRTLRIKDGWARPEHVARVKQQLCDATSYIMRAHEAKALQEARHKRLEIELRPRLTDQRSKRARAKLPPPPAKDDDWG
jgi:hypothetical protein